MRHGPCAHAGRRGERRDGLLARWPEARDYIKHCGSEHVTCNATDGVEMNMRDFGRIYVSRIIH